MIIFWHFTEHVKEIDFKQHTHQRKHNIWEVKTNRNILKTKAQNKGRPSVIHQCDLTNKKI